MNRAPTATARGLARALLAVLVFTAAFVSVGAGLEALLRSLGPEPTTDLAHTRELASQLRRIRDRFAGAGPRVLLVGDSVLSRTVVTDGDTVNRVYRPQAMSRRVQRLLREGPDAADPEGRVESLTAPGLGYTSAYHLSGRIAALQPDLVLLELNGMTLSSGWRRRKARPELAGQIAPARIPEALFLPLEPVGLSVDRVVWAVARHRLGLDPLAADLRDRQRRFHAGVRALPAGLERRLGLSADARATKRFRVAQRLRKHAPGRGDRLSAHGTIDAFEGFARGIADDDPALPYLAAATRVLRREGIGVIVFVAPANIEHLDALGLHDPERTRRGLARIGASVRESGGDFLDLHDLVGDAGFVDALHHLSWEGEPGAQQLAQELVRAIRAALATTTERAS